MIQYLYLGRVAYDEALRLQAKLVELRYQGGIENVLLLLEHPPVLTLGRNANRANVLASDALLASRGVTLHEINRGGDVTYHGPGQLVGYPIFDLRGLRNSSGGRMGPVDFVRQMEEALIRLCGVYGVRAGRIAGLTGVWCGLPCGRQLFGRESWRKEDRRDRHSRFARDHFAWVRFQRNHESRRFSPDQSLRPYRSARHQPGARDGRARDDTRIGIDRSPGGRAVWPRVWRADCRRWKPRRPPRPASRTDGAPRGYPASGSRRG